MSLNETCSYSKIQKIWIINSKNLDFKVSVSNMDGFLFFVLFQLDFFLGGRKKKIICLSMFMNRSGVKGVFDVIPGYPKAVFLIKNCNEK